MWLVLRVRREVLCRRCVPKIGMLDVARLAFSVGSTADVVRSKSLSDVACLTFDVKSRVDDMRS